MLGFTEIQYISEDKDREKRTRGRKSLISLSPGTEVIFGQR